MKVLTVFLFACLGTHTLFAQDAVPRGNFHAHKVKLGEPVIYSLVFRHSPTLEVVFPDSTYDFSPFELLQKQFFPTQTDSLGSYDSVAYTLATYELDKIQYLSLPAILPSEDIDEAKKIFSDRDSVQLVEIIKEIPEEKTAFEDTSMANVKQEFNYPYLLIAIAFFLILAIILFVLFGGKVRTYFKKKKLEKAHQKFIVNFDKLLAESSNKELEKPIGLWKKYTGTLINAPLETYTTKEIDQFINNPKLVKVLREADMAIYSGKKNTAIKQNLPILKEFTEQEYQKMLEKEFGKKKIVSENENNLEK